MKGLARNRLKGWLALSPLLVFLIVYLVSSIIAADFYKVPVASGIAEGAGMDTALVSLANLCTANNTIAIITTGRISKDISTKYGVDSRKAAKHPRHLLLRGSGHHPLRCANAYGIGACGRFCRLDAAPHVLPLHHGTFRPPLHNFPFPEKNIRANLDYTPII